MAPVAQGPDIDLGKIQQFARVTRLRVVRESRGMSKTDLARVSGVSRSRIANLEDGHHNRHGYQTRRTVEALCTALGCTVEDIADINPAYPAMEQESRRKRREALQTRRDTLRAHIDKHLSDLADVERELLDL